MPNKRPLDRHVSKASRCWWVCPRERVDWLRWFQSCNTQCRYEVLPLRRNAATSQASWQPRDLSFKVSVGVGETLR